MSWLAVTFTAEKDQAEHLSDVLLAAGALSVAIESLEPNNEIYQNESAEELILWQSNSVSALFEEAADIKTITRLAGIREYRVETLPEQDWVRATQAQFLPIPISSRLTVTPSWHKQPEWQETSLILDPGLAFGTGTHPSTRLCLEWLSQYLQGPVSLLDYGCGSGILALAAAKLGAGRVLGVDIDELAVEVARGNAAKNKLNVEFCHSNDLPHEMFDIVTANILAQPLTLLAPLLAGLTRPHGEIVLSGILLAQAEALPLTYEQWFIMHKPRILDGWACLTGTKRDFL